MKRGEGFDYSPGDVAVEQPPPSIDGHEFAHIPDKMRERIKLALKLQEHVDERIYSLEILSGEVDLLTKLLEGINCHKATLYLRGDISRAELQKKSDAPARAGYKEVRTLGTAHEDKMTWFPQDISEYADAHPEQFPFSVHVFEQEKGGLRPAHSFVLLGKDAYGRYLCFHKVGPYPDMPFELSTMDKILAPYEALDTAFLAHPIENQN